MAFRIAPLTKGSLPKAPAKRNVPRRLHDRAYLAFLHELPCCVSGTANDVIAHHITIGRGRLGVKEDDSLAIPLSSQWHNDWPESLHMVGEVAFWRRWKIEPFALAADLYALFKTHGPVSISGAHLISAHRRLAQRRVEIGVPLFFE